MCALTSNPFVVADFVEAKLKAQQRELQKQGGKYATHDSVVEQLKTLVRGGAACGDHATVLAIGRLAL